MLEGVSPRPFRERRHLVSLHWNCPSLPSVVETANPIIRGEFLEVGNLLDRIFQFFRFVDGAGDSVRLALLREILERGVTRSEDQQVEMRSPLIVLRIVRDLRAANHAGNPGAKQALAKLVL